MTKKVNLIYSYKAYKRLREEVTQLRYQHDKIFEPLRKVYETFSKRHTLNKLEKALAILHRYNLPWSRNHLHHPQKLPDYIKSVSNPFAEMRLQDLLKCPALYRLNFIKQLSTVCYSQFLDASHHRMPHSIGTTEVAVMFLEAVGRELPHRFNFEGVEINDNERDAVIIYALVHDLFHGPMGHSLELMRDVLQDYHIRIDKYHLKRNLETGGLLDRLIGYLQGPSEENEIKKYIKFFVDKASLEFKDLHDRYFLCQIVDGQIDADRIDYLLRDALHLGKIVSDKNRWIDLVMKARVVEEPEKSKGGNIKRRRMLAFSAEHKDRINDILSLRNIFYHEYYENPAKLALDDMLCHVIYYHLKHVGFTDERKVIYSGQKKRFTEEGKQFVDEFMKLTDENLFPFLIDLDGPWHAKETLNDLQTNRHFKCITTIGVRPDQVDDVITIRDELAQKINNALYDKKIELNLTDEELTDEQATSVVSNIFQKYKEEKLAKINGGQKELFEANLIKIPVLELIGQLYGNFEARLEFEKEIWKEVLKNETAANAWKEIFDRNYGPAALDERYQLTKIPQVHLTPPVYLPPTRSLKEMVKYKIRDVEGVSVLCYDNDSREVEWTKPDLMYAPNTYEAIFLVLSIHYDLSFYSDVVKIIIDKFWKRVLKFDWWVEANIRS